jgi:hypothetical protein
MRVNEPVFRDRNGLAAAATYQAVTDAERTPELFSSSVVEHSPCQRAVVTCRRHLFSPDQSGMATLIPPSTIQTAPTA